MSTGPVALAVADLIRIVRSKDHPSLKVILMDTLTHLASAIDRATAKLSDLENQNKELTTENADLKKKVASTLDEDSVNAIIAKLEAVIGAASADQGSDTLPSGLSS